MKRLLLGVLMTLFANFASAFGYTIELSEAMLQSKAESMMPLQKNTFFATLTLTDPLIDLIAATNEISLAAKINIKGAGNLYGNGQVSFTGSLRYVSATGAFYFDNLKINALTIDNFPSSLTPNIKALLEIVAQQLLSTVPVYKLKDDDPKHQLAKMSLKSIRVENEALLLELGLF